MSSSVPRIRSILRPRSNSSVGILINLSEDHLDRHGTMENYAAVKARLVAGVPKDGIAIIGVDDEWCRAIAAELEKSGKRVVRVSVQQSPADGVYVEEERILRAVGGKASLIAEIGGIGSLRGLHNAQNAACAAAAALALGLEPAGVQSALRSFPGLAHRMEEVGHRGAVLFINNSKATNAEIGGAGARLLRHFLDRGRQAEDRRRRAAAQVLSAHPQGVSDRRGGESVRGHARGRRAARDHRHPRPGARRCRARCAELGRRSEPVVLLSPACASFDQYRNFEVRGDAFRDLVRALPGIVATKR